MPILSKLFSPIFATRGSLMLSLPYITGIMLFLVITILYLYLKLEKEKKNKEFLILSQKQVLESQANKLKKEQNALKDLKEKVSLLNLKAKRLEIKKASTSQKSSLKKIEDPVPSPLLEENTQLKRRLDHCEDQVIALTEQLKEKDKDHEILKNELKLQTENHDSTLQSKLLELKREQGKIKEKSQDQIKKNNKALLEIKLDKKNFERKAELEFRKLKKKLKHYQHFYAMSLSQKSMLEDKIANWEKALVILASWILKEERSEKNMGEFVASAIEKTGYGSLIEDEFNFKTLHLEENTKAPSHQETKKNNDQHHTPS